MSALTFTHGWSGTLCGSRRSLRLRLWCVAQVVLDEIKFQFAMTFLASTQHLWQVFCTFLCPNANCALTSAFLAALPLELLYSHSYKGFHY